MDIKTLREFEQRLLSQRSTAANRESWEAYANEWLNDPGTDPDTDRARAKINQGFEAGFDAAMNRVRAMLVELQTVALREPGSQQPQRGSVQIQYLAPHMRVLNENGTVAYTVLEPLKLTRHGLSARIRWYDGGEEIRHWPDGTTMVPVEYELPQGFVAAGERV